MNKFNLSLLALFSLFFILLLFNLSYPENYKFDENYTAFTAVSLITKQRREIWLPADQPISPPRGYDWQQPPLPKIIIAGSILLLGNESWVFRLPSVTAGVLTAIILYLLGKHFFSPRVGFLAAYLLIFDGLSFSLFRLANRDSFLLFFLTLSLYLSLLGSYLLSAIVAGFALASKWSAISLLPLLLLSTFKSPKNLHPAKLFFCFILIPLFVYLISYLPFFTDGFGILDFFSLHRSIISHLGNYALQVSSIHPFSSSWWQWPFAYKPIAYYLEGSKQIWAAGSPLVFISGLWATSSLLFSLTLSKRISIITQKKCQLGLILFSYFIFLLPWIIIYLLNPNSSASYLHYYLPSLLFLHLLNAFWLNFILQRGSKQQKLLAVSLLVLIPLFFFVLFPRLTGI